MRSRTAVTFALALAFGAALTLADGRAMAQPAGKSCFWTRNIRGLRSIDDRVVYVLVSGRDIYALELFSRCLGVDWAHRAALRSRTGGSICEGRGNAVEIYVNSTTARQQRCSVTNIRKLTPEEIAALPPRAIP
jgi:uncharacterized protein DUF6491